jgi:hypothetical protein
MACSGYYQNEKICFNGKNVFCYAEGSGGPESRKSLGVLYRDRRYYRKDRSNKVSYDGNSKKIGKAAVKPILSPKTDIERSAMGKPNIPTNMQLSGTVKGTEKMLHKFG